METHTTTNENGSLAYTLDAANSFLIHVLPNSPKEDVIRLFQPLYAQCPETAFKLAMMFGNLRKGGGGRPSMNGFVACMEHVWTKHPAHIIANVENIMDDVSCKMMLVLLKHLSNLHDPENSNNYWGNLDLIEKKKSKRWERTDKPDSPEARLAKKQKRKDRFAGHVHVLEEFSRHCFHHENCLFQIVQPKACVQARKTYPFDVTVPVPRTEMVRDRFELFCRWMHCMLEEWEEEFAAMQNLEERFVQLEDGGDGSEQASEQEEEEVQWIKTEAQRKRNKARRDAWEGPQKAATEKAEDQMMLAREFARVYSGDKELLANVEKQRVQDVIEYDAGHKSLEEQIKLVRDSAVVRDDCSVASTAENTEDGLELDGAGIANLRHTSFFFDSDTVQVQIPVPATKASTNPLCGYEVLPWLQQDFCNFVADRDRRLKHEASLQRKQRICNERRALPRYDENLCQLFEAVADAFVAFMTSSSRKREVFGFKYCPLPGCSADKATGNLDSKGIGHAVLKRFSVLKGFPMEDLSPYSTEFKSWVSTFRRTFGIPESFIGCRQIKQINLHKAPAMHLRNWGDRIHKRHNPQGFDQFEEQARQSLQAREEEEGPRGKKVGVNASNLMPHELLATLRDRSTSPADAVVAELQFLSIIQKTRIPKGMCIMPVVDVSGSMSGTPIQVAIAMGLIVACCQDTAFARLFMTFHEYPCIYQLPHLLGPGAARLLDVADSMYSKPWGGATNFNLCMDMMLAELEERRGGGEAISRTMLMVFTDMQFDIADEASQYSTNLDVMEAR